MEKYCPNIRTDDYFVFLVDNGVISYIEYIRAPGRYVRVNKKPIIIEDITLEEIQETHHLSKL